MNVCFNISYDGTSYHGWQRQENAITVQEVIEETLSKICGDEVGVVGCGRTDTGVHAKSYFLNCGIPVKVAKDAALIYRLNRMLPSDISVNGAFEVSPEFNARFDALSRTYRYYLHTEKNPFLATYSFLPTQPKPNFEKMNLAAKALLGVQDFTSFSKANTQTKTNLCNVEAAAWHKIPEGWYFEISANRFLRNMVRAIVGTLLEVGQSKLNVDQVKVIIDKKNRGAAGQSVPGNALFLHDITYPVGSMKAL